MIRRIAPVVAALGLVALAIWLPREEQVAADNPIGEAPQGVELRAERAAAAAPFVERWPHRSAARARPIRRRSSIASASS